MWNWAAAIKRGINKTLYGNPYGAPHSIKVTEPSEMPEIPEYLVLQGQKTAESIEVCTGDDFDKLQLIYEYLDEYNKFVQTFSVCKAGCNYCCKIDVAVTKLEALYIEKKTSRTANRSKKRSRDHRTACPLLSPEGVCTIYEFRPFNCRTFHTMDDPTKCATPGIPHNVYGVESHKVPYTSGCYRAMANIRNDLNRSGEVKDIRDYF